LWWLTRSKYNPNGCRQIPTSTGTSKHWFSCTDLFKLRSARRKG
jgi:hypothetical protein